jgi:2-oxoisovalerate dehydrogenase E1 component alpha subunit
MQNRDHLFGITLTQNLTPIKNGLIDIPMLQLLSEDGVLHSTGADFALTQDTAQKIYDTMQFVRVLDERMVSAQRQGRISFYLACTGEEAATVASAAALDDQDMIMSQYREQGALAYRGFSIRQFMDQLFSNELEANKGRQMPIHYGSKPLNFMTISSPLGTQIPQAAGYAFGQKMAGQPAITLCYFGEGAASEGDFHAGLNMASVLKCPVIFLCRNNGYAISTPTQEQFAGDGIASRGIGYGVKTLRVDGNDALAMYAATSKAREIALAEQCPVLIEAMTYRLAAHSTSDDPSGYRSKEEEQLWQTKDPLKRFGNWLQSQGWLDPNQQKSRVESLRQQVLAELKEAEKIPICGIEQLIEDVYDQPPWHLKEQLAQLQKHIKAYPEHYPRTSWRLVDDQG